jgi:hypothetical protein
MGKKEDDEKAYTTYDDIVGRSIRRGTRKAISALTLGLISDEPELSDPLTHLAKDAAKEAPQAYRRSRQSRKDGEK